MKTIKGKRNALVSKNRQHSTRQEIVRFLIVCEGEETEANYFRSFIKNRWSEIQTIHPTIKGCAKGTCQLVKEAKKIRKDLEQKRDAKFDRVWLVFDKDDFKDFNKAILAARKEDMQCAWSNEAFELWYCLHFQNIGTTIHRNQYIKIIEKAIKRASKQKNYKYNKASKDFYEVLQKYGNEEKAKKRAEQLRNKFDPSNKDFAKQNPRTEIDLLINELKNPDSILEKLS
ncbi:RloB family protein [Hoylesella nanceiensis]|jgi:hypothetical protein